MERYLKKSGGSKGEQSQKAQPQQEVGVPQTMTSPILATPPPPLTLSSNTSPYALLKAIGDVPQHSSSTVTSSSANYLRNSQILPPDQQRQQHLHNLHPNPPISAAAAQLGGSQAAYAALKSGGHNLPDSSSAPAHLIRPSAGGFSPYYVPPSSNGAQPQHNSPRYTSPPHPSSTNVAMITNAQSGDSLSSPIPEFRSYPPDAAAAAASISPTTGVSKHTERNPGVALVTLHALLSISS